MILYNPEKHSKAIAAINKRNDAIDDWKTTRPPTKSSLRRDELNKINETQIERIADVIYRKQERMSFNLNREELARLIKDTLQ